MTMTDIHDDDLAEDQDGDTDLIRKLRSQLRAKTKSAKEADELRAWKAEREQQDAFRDAGLQLNERQMRALKAAHDGELTPEGLRKTAEELGFVEVQPDPLEGEIAEQSAIANASTGTQSKGGLVITPATIEQWPPEKRLEFRQQHPQAFEALKRGDEVTGIAF